MTTDQISGFIMYHLKEISGSLSLISTCVVAVTAVYCGGVLLGWLSGRAGRSRPESGREAKSSKTGGGVGGESSSK